jgi:hypothetical protein
MFTIVAVLGGIRKEEKLIKNFILISRMGGGKDTLASFMPNHCCIALGDQIRYTARILGEEGVPAALDHIQWLIPDVPASIVSDLIEWWKLYGLDKKNRLLLQTIGTELRKYNDSVWIDAAKKLMLPNEQYVITDCRRKAEFDSFRDFISIYIDADTEVRKQRLIARDGTYDPSWEIHPAELEIEDLQYLCDFTVVNNGTLEALEEQINDILEYVGGKY